MSDKEQKLEAALYAVCQAIRHLKDASAALRGMGSGLGFGEHGEDAEAFVVGLRARIKVELARMVPPRGIELAVEAETGEKR